MRLLLHWSLPTVTLTFQQTAFYIPPKFLSHVLTLWRGNWKEWIFAPFAPIKLLLNINTQCWVPYINILPLLPPPLFFFFLLSYQLMAGLSCLLEQGLKLPSHLGRWCPICYVLSHPKPFPSHQRAAFGMALGCLHIFIDAISFTSSRMKWKRRGQ